MPQSRRPLVARPLLDRSQLSEAQVKIVETCTELFVRNGYHQTSVRDIVEALGWPMGALYQHVKTKRVILEMVGHVIMNDLSRGLWELELQGTYAEKLAQALRFFVTTVDRMQAKVKLIYRESASLSHEQRAVLQRAELTSRELLAALVREGITAGEFAPTDPDLIAHDIIALGHMWALKDWALSPAIDVDTYVTFHTDLIVGRLMTKAMPGVQSA